MTTWQTFVGACHTHLHAPAEDLGIISLSYTLRELRKDAIKCPKFLKAFYSPIANEQKLVKITMSKSYFASEFFAGL